MTACDKVDWFPPDGSGPVTFVSGGDLHLSRFDGSFSTKTGALTRKSAGQIGVTMVDRMVSERRVALQCYLRAATPDAFQAAKLNLIKALSGVPGDTIRPTLGTLRVHRPGQSVVETLAEPVDSPQEVRRHTTRSSTLDIEWLCPSPLWQETADQIVTLEPVPGNPWVSPWFSPWESPAAQSSGEATNGGHVPVGIRVRFFGPQNTVRLINDRTGEQLQVFGDIAAGEFVEVDTEARTVTVNGSSALDRWDFAGSWWRLQPGAQTIVAEANTADSTACTVVLWRNALAGI